jgi:hypothetical protein
MPHHTNAGIVTYSIHAAQTITRIRSKSCDRHENSLISSTPIVNVTAAWVIFSGISDFQNTLMVWETFNTPGCTTTSYSFFPSSSYTVVSSQLACKTRSKFPPVWTFLSLLTFVRILHCQLRPMAYSVGSFCSLPNPHCNNNVPANFGSPFSRHRVSRHRVLALICIYIAFLTWSSCMGTFSLEWKEEEFVGSLSSVAAKALRLLTADRDVARTSVCERHTLPGLTPPPTKSKDEIASYSMIKLSEETQA